MLKSQSYDNVVRYQFQRMVQKNIHCAFVQLGTQMTNLVESTCMNIVLQKHLIPTDYFSTKTTFNNRFGYLPI